MCRWQAHQLWFQFQTWKWSQPLLDWAIALFGLHPVTSIICLLHTLKQSIPIFPALHSCSLRSVLLAQKPSQWPGRSPPRNLTGDTSSSQLVTDLSCTNPMMGPDVGPCTSTSSTDKGPRGSPVIPRIRQNYIHSIW